MKNKLSFTRKRIQLKYINTLEIFCTLIILIILSGLIMSITLAFSSASFNQRMFISYFLSIRLLFMNFIPIFLFMTFTYLLSNRLWVGFSLTALLFVIMSIINKYKLMYRDDPFSFIDIKLVRESIIMAEKYSLKLTPLIIILIIVLIAIAIILKIFFKNRVKKIGVRIFLLITVIAAGFFIFKNFYFNTKLYKELGDKSLINIWIQSEQYQSKGFVYPFIYSIKDAKETELEGYDEKKAIEDLSTMKYSDIPEEQKVNIISIMLEAYNDFSEFKNVNLGIDIYENFHKFKDESIHGKLITNVFAGDTINTERAFVTGFYNHPKYFKNTNSFVWYFKEQGYMTEAMHPITGSFYNRRSINEYLGFESFDHYENKYKYIQEAILDDIDFFDYIIEGFENSKKNDQPYFNFSVTYQNHGPYATEKYTEKQYLKKNSSYDEGIYNIINNYFAGIYKTDKALKKLFDYFRNEEEPTVIIVFGDHNPWLGKGHVGYDMLGINLDLSNVEGFKNYFQTPYIIWGNSGAKKTFNKDFIGEGSVISPNFLMSELFEYIGWNGDEYMQYILNLKEKIDVNNKNYFKVNGEFIKELSTENKSIWKDFQNVEYYYSHNFKK